MDIQALLNSNAALPALGGAAVIVLVAIVFGYGAFMRMRMVQRHPGLLPKFKNPTGYRKLAAAESAEKAGQSERAGDLYGELQLTVAARRNYVLAKAAHKLADSYLRDGAKLDAAQWCEKAGEYKRAKDLYVEVGRIKEAAIAAKLAGDLEDAADLYLQAGDAANAASLYKAVENIEKAVAAMEIAGDPLGAARFGAQRVSMHMRSVREGSYPGPAKEKEVIVLAARVAPQLATSSVSEEVEQALQLYLFARNYAAAAELYQRLGKREKAVEYYLRAGRRRNAAEVLDELGRPKESAKLKGEDFLERGMIREAVAQFEAADQWERAAELLEQMGDHLKAAAHYQRLGNLLKAGELLVKEGKDADAAVCFQKAGDIERALICYEKIGDWGSFTELLESLQRYYEAGLNYLQRGLSDKAIKAFQRVDEEHASYGDASLKLGDLFQEKGMFGLAKEKYLSILGGDRIQRKNLDIFYKLASALESNGELTQATQSFEKILGFDFHYKDVGQRISDLKSRIASRTTPAAMTPSGSPHVDPFAQTIVQPAAQKRRYEVISELGRGGMGVVYKARDTVLDRIVALKVLPPMFRQNATALRNFFREAKSAAALTHPNIVTIYDTGEEAGSPYIAMEFVEGQDLKQIVSESGALPLGPLVLVFGQMCQALGYAHEQSIVHRDIKPSNVLWTKQKQAKITDFGLARALNQSANTLTTTGGTPYYMSPEQTLGNPLDHRTDIYSLGVMMYELATGKLPFSEGDIGYHHVHTVPTDLRSNNAKIPAALSAIVMRMLAKKPEDRYSDAHRIFEELRQSFSTGQP